jgi:hypothetical protein
VNGEKGFEGGAPRGGAGSCGQLPFTVYSSLFTLFTVGCGISPLRGHAVVGRDAYLIFVADGAGNRPDLFAVRAEGGPVFQITFTSLAELSPALAPDGGSVAFLRGRTIGDSLPATVWLLNLVNGAERELALPRGSPAPDGVGWSADGRSLYVRAGALIYRLDAPPAPARPRSVTGIERLAAESSLAVLVGEPPFGRVVPCHEGLCAQTDGGAPAPFASRARDAVRWGDDSVGFLVGSEVVVRPVGPGRSRRLEWSGAPANPRQLTYFPGKGPP